MSRALAGHAALVGGGSRGLGYATAHALAAAGCDVALWSRDAARLAVAAERLSADCAVRVVTVVHDAADPSCAEAVVTAASSGLGKIDIFVMNSGGPPVSDPTATSPATWRAAFQSVALAQIEIATALLPGMRRDRFGRLVALLSSGLRQPIPDLPYSNSCRAALALWMKSCVPVVAGDGVTINGILTGRIDTERARELDAARASRTGREERTVRSGREEEIPVGRYGRPEEIASLVSYLCSAQASYVTGALIPVDGGLVGAL